MKITSALLKPSLAEIESGFLRLITLLNGQNSDEAQDLKGYIEKQLRQVHKAKIILFSLETNTLDAFPTDPFEDFRMLKLRLRFAERRWRLILSNKARSLKLRGGIDHVASVAA